MYLAGYGITGPMAIKIYDTYGPGTQAVMEENPYRLAEDISGIGFKMADDIASRMGIKTDSDYRIRSGILYTLLLAAAEGHVYLPKEILLRNTSYLLRVEPELIEIQLANLAMDKKLVMKTKEEKVQIYATSYYYAELNCAKMLWDLNGAVKIFSEEDDLIAKEYKGKLSEKIKLMVLNLRHEMTYA